MALWEFRPVAYGLYIRPVCLPDLPSADFDRHQGKGVKTMGDNVNSVQAALMNAILYIIRRVGSPGQERGHGLRRAQEHPARRLPANVRIQLSTTIHRF